MASGVKDRKRVHNPKVSGSSPAPATNFYKRLEAGYTACLFSFVTNLRQFLSAYPLKASIARRLFTLRA